MIKKTINYKDYDGNDVERDFWFHLDEGEIALVELSEKTGFSELLRVAQENDDPTVVGPAFEKIVLGAVGRREGEQFKKDQTAIDALRWTGAYSALIIWMLKNPVESGEFINGMLPGEAQEALKNNPDAQKQKAELVEKFRAKTKEMGLPEPVEVGVSEENMENIEVAAAAPLLANDFSAMTPEEFEAWKASQVY